MKRLAPLALASLFVLACDGSVTGTDSLGDIGDEAALAGTDDSAEMSFVTSLAVGDTARVCNTGSDGLRQRTGPGTGYSILRVMPEGTSVKILARSSDWYRNDWGGRVGWSHGAYLCLVSSGGGGGSTGGGGGFDAPLSRDGVIQVSKAAVGFSYWWGGGAFAAGGAHGACYGSCPGCSHSGQYGGDCSGFAAKAWMLPEAMPMSANRHPFSTYHFRYQSNHWSSLSRGSTARADALVYNTNGAGHIVIFESGDPWGSMWTYESRGCSYGVVHNVRTCSSSYVARRRSGI